MASTDPEEEGGRAVRGSLLASYGFLGLGRLGRNWLLTRLLFPGARLIRFPVYIRGRRQMDFGQKLTVGVGARIEAFAQTGGIVLHIGARVEINDYVHIAAIGSVRIGDDVLIASRVFISDHNHGGFDDDSPSNGPDVPPSMRPLRWSPVSIGERVWIGENVCILPGVTIGPGAVIGAGSVVTRDVPGNAIAAGNPARVIRRYSPASHRWEPQ
jgi:lipopolysaccharide O-acetyltransferase